MSTFIRLSIKKIVNFNQYIFENKTIESGIQNYLNHFSSNLNSILDINGSDFCNWVKETNIIGADEGTGNIIQKTDSIKPTALSRNLTPWFPIIWHLKWLEKWNFNLIKQAQRILDKTGKPKT